MKHYVIFICMIFVIVTLLAISFPAYAATITFRNEPVTCRGTAVTLGDVATITPDRDDDAASIELLRNMVPFPAPIAGKDRTINYRELYDYLNMRGVRVGQHTFAGASQVTVKSEPQKSMPPSQTTDNNKVFLRRDATQTNNESTPNHEHEEESIRNAVMTFLKNNVDANAPWRIDVTLSAEGRKRLTEAGEIIGIRAVVDNEQNNRAASQYDPAEAWLGRQRFELQCKSIRPETGMHRTLTVEVNIALPQAVVVTRHVVPKGKILSAADVRLSYITEDQTPVNVTKSRTEGSSLAATRNTVGGITTQRGRDAEISSDVATRIDEVIGKAAVLALRNNTPVQFSQLEKPLLVKRSEAVTLYLRNGGITIKMTAKAKEDGRAGDVITVEMLTDKMKTNLARVVDYGTVEVEKR